MKKKLQFIEIPVRIYEISVIIFFGGDLEFIIKTGIKKGIKKEQFTKSWKNWVENGIKEIQGLCCNYGEGNKDVLVWMCKYPETLKDYRILYHELYHATDHIADSINFDSVDKLSEPRAYLFEYLFNEASLILWNKK